MNPKEKALELVDKFRDIENKYKEYTDYKQAKQCALIVVDEIFKLLNDIWLDSFTMGESNNKFYNYWQEVKKEIELL